MDADDVLVTVFRFLPTKDRVTVSEVSKYWHQIARSSRVWRELYLLPNDGGVQAKWMQSLPVIAAKVADLSRGELRLLYISAARICMKSLAAAFEAISKTSHNLSTLIVIEIREDSGPALELWTSEFEDLLSRALISLAERCPALQYVALSADLFRIEDKTVLRLAELCPGLRTLGIFDCHLVSSSTVAVVVRMCPRLRSVNVRWCARCCVEWRALTKKLGFRPDIHVHYVQEDDEVDVLKGGEEHGEVTGRLLLIPL